MKYITNNKAFILISIFILITVFINHELFNEASISISIYLLFKWIYNHKKCTVSYIECKIRNIPIKEGVVYRLLDELIQVNKSDYCIVIYILLVINIFIQLNKI